MEVKYMAKVEVQKAQYVKEETFTDESTGKVKATVYTFSLEGREFEVFKSKYFQARPGKTYYPVLSVKPTAYMKDGKAYARNSVVVDWHEVD
jgi:hypothetical protein